MTLSDLAGKKILILGYAREGKATELFLKKYVPDARISIADKTLDDHYLDAQKDADLVVKTPGIPKRMVTAPYTTATNLFFAFLKERGMKNTVIGITGSKGKSTTSSLIAAILKEAGKPVALIGNIGTPALTALMEPVAPETIFVMELSSYQTEDLEATPDISVFTSLFPEHLDYHEGFENYVAAKAQLLAHATPAHTYVYNPRYARLTEIATQTKATGKSFETDIPFDVSAAKLKGEHNLDNIRGAMTVAHLLGIDDATIHRAVLVFEPLPHRLTDIGTFRGIRFVDDAIATAPEPTILAIQTLKDVDTILLGGTDRGYDFAELAKVIKQSGIRQVVLFPDTGARIEQALLDTKGAMPELLYTESMDEAVAFAFAKTAPGKICLLSTASPSYRLWKSFEEKGEAFTSAVKRFSLYT